MRHHIRKKSFRFSNGKMSKVVSELRLLNSILVESHVFYFNLPFVVEFYYIESLYSSHETIEYRNI